MHISIAFFTVLFVAAKPPAISPSLSRAERRFQVRASKIRKEAATEYRKAAEQLID